MQRILNWAAAAGIAAAALTAGGCASDAPKSSSMPPQATTTPAQPSATTAAFYALVENPKDGRLYAFGDAKNYLMFMDHGEVPLTRSRIGAGPGGKTIVFGITGDDVKKKQPSAAELVFDGKLVGGANFHGEVFKGGRYYVFGEWQDFKDYQTHGEMIYTFTEIGTGPKGETVIYGLNKGSVKAGRPVKLIERFGELRAKK